MAKGDKRTYHPSQLSIVHTSRGTVLRPTTVRAAPAKPKAPASSRADKKAAWQSTLNDPEFKALQKQDKALDAKVARIQSELRKTGARPAGRSDSSSKVAALQDKFGKALKERDEFLKQKQKAVRQIEERHLSRGRPIEERRVASPNPSRGGAQATPQLREERAGNRPGHVGYKIPSDAEIAKKHDHMLKQAKRKMGAVANPGVVEEAAIKWTAGDFPGVSKQAVKKAVERAKQRSKKKRGGKGGGGAQPRVPAGNEDGGQWTKA